MYRLNTPHITKRHKMELKSYVALKRKTPVHGQWRNDRCLMEGSWRKKRRRSLLGVLFFWGPVGWGIVSSIQWRDCRSTDLSSCFLCWDERPSSFGWRSRSWLHSCSQVIGHILGEWFTNMLTPDWQLLKKSGMCGEGKEMHVWTLHIPGISPNPQACWQRYWQGFSKSHWVLFFPSHIP